MKTVFGTLILIFVILLNLTQRSAQSDNCGNNELPDSEIFENIPAGRSVRLCNGHSYTSIGSAVIKVKYNSITKDAYIRQGNRSSKTSTRLYPSEETYEHIPHGVRINLANGHSYESLGGSEPIYVHYNTFNGVAHVRQGSEITILGEEGFVNYSRNYHHSGDTTGRSHHN